MEIIWTAKAIFDLKQIYDFLSSKSVIAAEKETQRVYLTVGVLEEKFLRMGQVEPLLKHLKREYRYLISTNYKIIYSISSACIFIHTIFDTRQNPKKLKVKR